MQWSDYAVAGAKKACLGRGQVLKLSRNCYKTCWNFKFSIIIYVEMGNKNKRKKFKNSEE